MEYFQLRRGFFSSCFCLRLLAAWLSAMTMKSRKTPCAWWCPEQLSWHKGGKYGQQAGRNSLLPLHTKCSCSLCVRNAHIPTSRHFVTLINCLNSYSISALLLLLLHGFFLLSLLTAVRTGREQNTDFKFNSFFVFFFFIILYFYGVCRVLLSDLLAAPVS